MVFVLINLKLLHKDETERNGDNDSQRVFVMMIRTMTNHLVDSWQDLRDIAGAEFRVVFVAAD